jgi:hypothetical protein
LVIRRCGHFGLGVGLTKVVSKLDLAVTVKIGSRTVAATGEWAVKVAVRSTAGSK